jgi:uncharacterized HAD superfamily protein
VLKDMETDPLVHDVPLRDRYARKVIRRWRNEGHQVFVVTAREEVSRSVTANFLDANALPHDGLEMGVQIKTGYDVLIDDAPHNVLAASSGGGLALLMDQPYNQHLLNRPALQRVHDWMDVESTLLAAFLPAVRA